MLIMKKILLCLLCLLPLCSCEENPLIRVDHYENMRLEPLSLKYYDYYVISSRRVEDNTIFCVYPQDLTITYTPLLTYYEYDLLNVYHYKKNVKYAMTIKTE